ncbi:MAG: tRNA (adenosine(37)-N6)-threonylcarbamoyltransferase complex dimerization subunit type 1 TsaB [Anaerolineales bacterium]
MTLLAIDASTRISGVALYDGERVRYECIWESRDFHGVDLAPGINLALEKSSMGVGDLQAVAVAIGPGSYTGLRIGLALGKGIAFSEDLDLIAVPTLDVVAAGQPVSELPLVAVLQAGRGRLAIGWYKSKKERWQPDGEPQLVTVKELVDAIRKPTMICGELDGEARRALGRKHKNALISSPAWSQRRPAILAELAWERWREGEVDERHGLTPRYLQSSEAVPV